jgi:hypothetical protein
MRANPTASLDIRNIWLKRLSEAGDCPERSFMNAPVSAELIKLGLVEVVTPRAPYPAYATLTQAGHDKWEEGGF